MPISAKQIERRKSYIGSSDVAAVMGFDPFRNAYDVWLEKTGKLKTIEETKVMKRGKYLEFALLNFAEDNLGPLERDPAKLEFVKDDLLLSHPDALFEGNPIEAKSQGNYSKEEWGESNTDQVPDRVIIQCHTHLICTGMMICYVPVYLPYREFQLFYIEGDKEIIESIMDAAWHFWNGHILRNVPPEDIVPNLAVIKHVHKSKVITDMPADLWQNYQIAKAKAKEAKANQDKAQAELLAEIDRRKRVNSKH